MDKVVCGWLLGACLVAMAAPAWSEELRLDRTFNAAPGGRLSVSADSGDVTVAGSDSDRVVVHIVAKGTHRVLERLKLDAQHSAAGVIVTAKRERAHWFGGQWSWGDDDIRINVTVPHRYNLEIATSGGDISVSQVHGETNGRTSGGNLRLDDLQGAVRMRTSGGDVDVASVRGNVDIQTSGGNLHVRSVTGDFNGHTSGGDVGVEHIHGAVQLHTSGGNITADRIRGSIDAGTSGGDVRLTQIDGAIKARTSGGNVRVGMVGANRGINVSTSGGEVVLELPEDLTATLEASSGNGRVRSDLPVASTHLTDSYLSGTINGGGEPIYARTSGGGNVVLHARRSAQLVERPD